MKSFLRNAFMIITFENNSNEMKKILSYALCLAFLMLGTSFKSNLETFEGEITYAITYLKVPAELAGMESMLPKNVSMLLSGRKSKIVQEVMGGSQIVIADENDGSGDMLMDMMGMKIHVHMSKEELDKETASVKTTINELNETKQILGYACKKAEMIVDGKSMEVWYTDKIDAFHKDFEKLDGFPLEYITTEEGMTIKMTASKIDERKLDKAEFEIPSGYQTYTLEELGKLMGGE